MPIVKKPPSSSSSRVVEAISANLSRLAAELEELRGRASDKVLQQRAKELNYAVAALKDFKTKLEAVCHRVQEDMDDLFCDNLWDQVCVRS